MYIKEKEKNNKQKKKIYIFIYTTTYIFHINTFLITFITLKNCFINKSLENQKGGHHSDIHFNIIP